jgi:hypothetical protein
MQPRKQKFTESEDRDDFNSPGELVEDKAQVKFGDAIEPRAAEQARLSKPIQSENGLALGYGFDFWEAHCITTLRNIPDRWADCLDWI